MKLKEAFEEANLDGLMTAKPDIETIIDKYAKLKTLDVNSVELVIIKLV